MCKSELKGKFKRRKKEEKQEKVKRIRRAAQGEGREEQTRRYSSFKETENTKIVKLH